MENNGRHNTTQRSQTERHQTRPDQMASDQHFLHPQGGATTGEGGRGTDGVGREVVDDPLGQLPVGQTTQLKEPMKPLPPCSEIGFTEDHNTRGGAAGEGERHGGGGRVAGDDSPLDLTTQWQGPDTSLPPDMRLGFMENHLTRTTTWQNHQTVRHQQMTSGQGRPRQKEFLRKQIHLNLLYQIVSI